MDKLKIEYVTGETEVIQTGVWKFKEGMLIYTNANNFQVYIPLHRIKKVQEI